MAHTLTLFSVIILQILNNVSGRHCCMFKHMVIHTDTTDQGLSEVNQTGIDRESGHTATAPLARNTLCYHHPVNHHTQNSKSTTILYQRSVTTNKTPNLPRILWS